MSLFDNLQTAMLGTVTNTMGYSATWVPKAGGEAQTATVLYNGPTEKEKLFSTDYDPDKLMMEYHINELPGLFDAGRSNSTTEEIEITGIGTFYIKSVKKKWDGKTYEAQLEVKPQ
jgi:hypothetical protein